MAEAASESGLDVTGQTSWTFGAVERTFTQTRAGHEVRGFPALVDEGSTVGLRVFGSEAEQHAVAPARPATAAGAAAAVPG